jgi:hypothetical protein
LGPHVKATGKGGIMLFGAPEMWLVLSWFSIIRRPLRRGEELTEFMFDPNRAGSVFQPVTHQPENVLLVEAGP